MERNQHKEIINNKDGTETHLVYENNNLIAKYVYKNGVLHGLSEMWFEDNPHKKEKEILYENGKEINTTWWHKNGGVYMMIECKYDTKKCVTQQWYPNGNQCIRQETKSGVLHGYETSWYENGKYETYGRYENGKREGPYHS
jgi:antitoxin component YwqK of YwqJK toxin-antitoxin module